MSSVEAQSVSGAAANPGPTPGLVERRALEHRGTPTVQSSADPKKRSQASLSISIISINYRPELTGIAVYSSDMAEFFASHGHRVDVHTGFPYYPTWQKQPEDQGRLFQRLTLEGVRVRRCYLYVPRRPSALRRILHEFTFTISASCSYLLARRSDVTIIVAPPLPLGIPIALIARLKSSKCIFHVQDLQPDAALELGMLRAGSLTRILFAMERITYGLVDRVSTISLAMRAKIIAKGIDPRRVWLFRNWANDDMITASAEDLSLRDEWNYANRFVVLYAGNMGVKQGLDSVLDAARLLQDVPEIVFVIVGAGGEKDMLLEKARRLNLKNVDFRPPVPKSDLARLLACADVSVIPQKAGVKDIVLPSKLANLLLSRRTVVAAAAPESELGQLIHGANCGLLSEPGDPHTLAAAINHLRNHPEERRAMADRGAAFAREHLGLRTILSSFLESLEELRDSAGLRQSTT